MSLTQRNIAIALSVLLTCAVIYYFRNIVTYVLIAWVVSTMGQPLMRLFERAKWGGFFIPRTLAAALALIIFALFVSSIFAFFLPMVVEQANNLAQIDFKTITTALEKPLSDLTNKGHRFGFIPQKETAISLIEKELASWLKPTAPNQVVGSVLSTASSLIVGTFAVLFISFFF